MSATNTPKVGLDDFLVKHGADALSELIDRTPLYTPPPRTPDLTDMGGDPREDLEEGRKKQRERKKAEDKAEKGPTPLTLLVKRAAERFELFRNQSGEAFASKDKVSAFPVEGTDFRDHLYDVFENHVERETPATSTIRNAEQALAAVARRNDERQVFQRSGRHEDAVYVYRSDLDHLPTEAIRIDRDGWRVVQESPVRFYRRRTAGVLPVPTSGSMDDLRPFLNLTDDYQFPVICAWIAAAVAGVRTPIMLLSGVQGSAKSTYARLVMWLLDPSSGSILDAPLLRPPKDEEDVAVAARNNHALCYDNLSGLSPELADLMCMIATGGKYSARKKYTNLEQVTVDLQRPMILTGIDLPSLRGDFLERTLTVRLKPISKQDRKAEEDLFAEFLAARPRILAGVYALVVRGLDTRIDLGGLDLNRMADFDKFAARAVGKEAVEQINAAAVADNDDATLEGCLFYPHLLQLMSLRHTWRGTSSELLKELTDQFNGRTPPPRWPGGPHILSGQLKRVTPSLERVEKWKIQCGDEARTNRKRLITIEKVHERTGEAEAETEAAVGDAEADSEATQPRPSRRATLLDDLEL